MKYCDLKEAADYFYYPYNNKNCICDFQPNEQADYQCQKCGQKVRVRENIIEFITDLVLDTEKKREHEENSTDITDEFIAERFSRDIEEIIDRYALRIRKKKILMLIKALNKIQVEEIAFLGCGLGTEIVLSLKAGLRPKRIFASDLTYSSTYLVQHSLSRFNLSCDLVSFTSDLDYVPLKNRAIPIVVFDAMHHTPDMHLTCENLLSFGYQNIFLVEPASNFFIRLLEKKGLSQRIEYSGCKPGRLDFKTVKVLVDKYNYELDINSLWSFPELFT